MNGKRNHTGHRIGEWHQRAKLTDAQVAQMRADYAVYAVARLQGGGVQFEVMSKAQVEAVRAQSKAGKSGPWVSHWEEMAKKTVIRRLFKYLPVSVEIQRAVTLDEAAEAGLPQGNEYVFDGDFEVVNDASGEQQ